MSTPFFATAAKGTEGALRDELRELRVGRVRADRGGVHFEGSREGAYRACLWSRIALRVLEVKARFGVRNAHDLYEGVRGISWGPYLSVAGTLHVRATSSDNAALHHTHFIAQKVKDAIVDSLRDTGGSRPSVDKDDPDLSVFLMLRGEEATLYLDYAGIPLHKRSSMPSRGAAPLKENLAATLVRLSRWNRTTPLHDPMCGSGTIPLEAMALAARRAPGLSRARFGFERWPSFQDAALLRAMRLDARNQEGFEGLPDVRGFDQDPDAIERAEENAATLDLPVRFQRTSLRAYHPGAATLITNPPYGERLAREEATLRDLARVIDQAPEAVTVLTEGEALQRMIQRKPARWLLLFNGPIACKALFFDPR